MHLRRNQIHTVQYKASFVFHLCLCFSSQIKTRFAGLLICFEVFDCKFPKKLNETSFSWCFSQFLNFAFCISHFAFLEVVGQNGLEPSTSRLSVVCSSQLSYWPISQTSFGGEYRDRTGDLLLARQALSQLS